MRHRHVSAIPVVIGLFLLLLTLPTVLVNIGQQQELRKQASERSYKLPVNAPVIPGKIIVAYNKSVAIETQSGVNQHTQQFSTREISKAPSNSIQTLNAIGTRSLDRVYPTAKFTHEKSLTDRMLGLIGRGPQPDPLANTFSVDIPRTANMEQAINILLKDPNVLYAEPDYAVQTLVAPNDPSYSQQWYLPKTNTPTAWDASTGSSNIVVAVVDTGIDGAHPDLLNNLVPGTNVIATMSATDTSDHFGHGTHVAGIIGAVGNNAIGVSGVNWNVKVMPIKVLDLAGGQSSDEANGIRYAADHGAHIINISLGSTVSEMPIALKEAVDYAVDRGITVVSAAGNAYDTRGPGLADTTYPAAFPNVIAVAAINQTDGHAFFSNSGNKIEVAAPGTNILSTMSSTNTLGSGCVGQQYCELQGTSMATPVVSGVAALLLAKNNSLTPSQVKEIITSTADNLGTPTFFGHGRVNAAAALAAATGQTASNTPTPTPSSAGSVAPSASANSSATASPTASAQASASPSTVPTSSLQIAQVAQSIANACGGKAILARRLADSSSAAGDRTWLVYTSGYSGIPFNLNGDIYIYVETASCALTLSNGQQIALIDGWNKETFTGFAQTFSTQNTPTNTAKKKTLLQQLLFQ